LNYRDFLSDAARAMPVSGFQLGAKITGSKTVPAQKEA
jgi:hypothetical protein